MEYRVLSGTAHVAQKALHITNVSDAYRLSNCAAYEKIAVHRVNVLHLHSGASARCRENDSTIVGSNRSNLHGRLSSFIKAVTTNVSDTLSISLNGSCHV